MKRRYIVGLCLAVVVVAAVVGTRCLQARRAMGCSVPVNKKLIDANTDLAIRLFKDAYKDHPKSNILLSSCGVSLALTLAYNGAMDDTRKAMGRSLGLNALSLSEINDSNAALMANLQNPGTGVTLSVANAAWVGKRYSIEPHFLKTAKESYKAEIRNIDFAAPSAASAINGWVRRETRGRVDSIAEDLDDMTVLCLTNAVYFKGVWTRQFDKAETQNSAFIVSKSDVVTVPTMHQKGRFRYLETDSFSAAALPYGSGRISMYVFVPKHYSTLSEFLGSLSTKNWEKWMSGFRETKISVRLPRWKLECRTDLQKPCSHLGMGVAFDPEKSDFRGLCNCGDHDNAHISVLKQNAFVEVNEEGTEAAAATYELFHARSGSPELRADRPFFYAIRDDRTGTILFLGTIVDPQATETAL